MLRSSLGHHEDYYIDFGGLAGLSVFLNLFGIVLEVFLSHQLKSLSLLNPDADDVLQALPNIRVFLTGILTSFFVGMILISFSVAAAMMSSQGLVFAAFACAFGGFLLVLLAYLLSNYNFVEIAKPVEIRPPAQSSTEKFAENTPSEQSGGQVPQDLSTGAVPKLPPVLG